MGRGKGERGKGKEKRAINDIIICNSMHSIPNKTWQVRLNHFFCYYYIHLSHAAIKHLIVLISSKSILAVIISFAYQNKRRFYTQA